MERLEPGELGFLNPVGRDRRGDRLYHRSVFQQLP
jgi:hypothetical protein